MTARTGLWACSAALLAALQLGCGDNPSDGGASDAAALTVQGWDRFEAGDFSAAQTRFTDAIAKDAAYAEAYNGRGWAAMRLRDYAAALTALQDAVAHGLQSADPLAGMALLHRDLNGGDPARVIVLANQALERAPQYRFAHDHSLDWRDLRLLLAQGYFDTGEYLLASAQITPIGGVAPDPQSPTFVGDLLAEIERLGRLLNG